MRRRIISVLIVFILLLTACGNGNVNVEDPQETAQNTPQPSPTAVQPEQTPEQTPEATPSQDPEVDPEVDPEEEVVPANPLTGLPMEEELINDRPIAVMINNLKAALPQQGVSQADVIYEVLAEGGITRMIAVYQSVDGVGKIGSVRSVRTYFLELVLGHDAVLLHAGGSPDSLDKIKEWGVTSLDSVSGPYEGSLFWRDSGRLAMMSREHTLVTSGKKIQELFPNYSFRKEHEEGYKYEVLFAENWIPENGSDAMEITVPFSDYKTGVLEHAGLVVRKYLVEEFDSPYVDGNTGKQVSVTNVLILKTACSAIPGDDAGRIAVDLTQGDGWYACGGKIIPIHWSKDGVNAPLVYTTQDGQPLTFAAGNSYVNIIPLEKEIVVK